MISGGPGSSISYRVSGPRAEKRSNSPHHGREDIENATYRSKGIAMAYWPWCTAGEKCSKGLGVPDRRKSGCARRRCRLRVAVRTG